MLWSQVLGDVPHKMLPCRSATSSEGCAKNLTTYGEIPVGEIATGVV